MHVHHNVVIVPVFFSSFKQQAFQTFIPDEKKIKHCHIRNYSLPQSHECSYNTIIVFITSLSIMWETLPPEYKSCFLQILNCKAPQRIIQSVPISSCTQRPCFWWSYLIVHCIRTRCFSLMWLISFQTVQPRNCNSQQCFLTFTCYIINRKAFTLSECVCFFLFNFHCVLAFRLKF